MKRYLLLLLMMPFSSCMCVSTCKDICGPNPIREFDSASFLCVCDTMASQSQTPVQNERIRIER